MHPTVLEDCGDGGMTWAMAVGLAKLLGPASSSRAGIKAFGSGRSDVRTPARVPSTSGS